MVSDEEQILDATPASDLLDSAAAGPAAIRGSFLRTGGYLVGVLLSVVSVPLLFHHLGQAVYGRYVDVIALVTIVQGVTDVGLGQIGVREYATRVGDRDRLMRSLVGVRLLLTSIGVLLALAFAIAAGYGSAVVAGTIVAGVGMVITVAQGTYVIPLAAELRLGWVTALDLVRQVLTVGGIVTLVLVGSSLFPFLALTVPVALIVLGMTVVLVRGTVSLAPAFDRAEWSLLVRTVLPFAAAVVVATIYLRLTVLLTSLLTNPVQSGYYNLPFAVISVLVAIPALTVGATLPVLARAARDDSDRLDYVLGRLVDVTLIVGVGLGLGVAIGAGFITEVLTAGKPAGTTAVLQIQAFAIVTQFVGAAWQYGLLALHRHRAILRIIVAGLAVSVALTFALVPTALAARGAAIAFSSGEAAVAILSLVALRAARRDLSFSLRVPSRVLLAAGLACLVLLIPAIGSLPRALLAGCIYVAVLAATRAFPPELLSALQSRRQPST